MTIALAIMVLCMPASTIDLNCTDSATMQLPVPYTRDGECQCGNSGRIGGVWLNYYSPCRCGSTTIVLAEPFPFPPLREDPPDTQLHRILRPSVYATSLNHPGLFDRSALLEIHPPDPLALLERGLGLHRLDQEPFDMLLDIGRLSRPTTAAVPEPTTLALLAVGAAIVVRRRKSLAA